MKTRARFEVTIVCGENVDTSVDVGVVGRADKTMSIYCQEMTMMQIGGLISEAVMDALGDAPNRKLGVLG